MGYTFKNGKFSLKRDPAPIQKSAAAMDVLQKLRSFLDKNEPDLICFLVTMWKHEGRAITYKELREAILAGDITGELLDEWMQDYNRFVVKYLQPAWKRAMDAAAEELQQKYSDWYYNPMADGIREWTENRSAEFVTSVTYNQMLGLRAVVQRAAVLQDINVDTLARAIRSMVGLYEGQARANMRYFEKLIASGVSEKRALDLSARYGARQARYRAMMISRQELAMAFNTGADQAVRQAQAAGYMGQVVKVFSCAEDERTCETCSSLEGKIIGMDEEFRVANRGYYKFTGLYPPVHIQCRCSVLYEEISPPDIR